MPDSRAEGKFFWKRTDVRRKSGTPKLRFLTL
jgi:hypothetical protein